MIPILSHLCGVMLSTEVRLRGPAEWGELPACPEDARNTAGVILTFSGSDARERLMSTRLPWRVWLK